MLTRPVSVKIAFSRFFLMMSQYRRGSGDHFGARKGGWNQRGQRGRRMVVSETDSVSLLQEYYAKKGVIPKYDVLPVAPADIRHFAFKYRVTVGDVSAIGSGSNKQDAKHKAARELLDKLDPKEVAKFLKPPKNVVNMVNRPRPPDGLKGREIGMFYAQMSKQKKAQNRDFIDINREQLKEVEKISRLLDENAHDVQDDAFFGKIDYQSEFMKSYHFNLDENAASAKLGTAESEEVESWEMLEEAQPDPIEETTQTPSKGNTISIF